ncbi:MAG: hypothetical protein WC214_07955 [Candidatus Omnitrophota bacterium]
MDGQKIIVLSEDIKKYICDFVSETVIIIENLIVTNVSRGTEDKFLGALTNILASFIDGMKADDDTAKLACWSLAIRAIDETGLWLNELLTAKRLSSGIEERIEAKLKVIAAELINLSELVEKNSKERI